MKSRNQHQHLTMRTQSTTNENAISLDIWFSCELFQTQSSSELSQLSSQNKILNNRGKLYHQQLWLDYTGRPDQPTTSCPSQFVLSFAIIFQHLIRLTVLGCSYLPTKTLPSALSIQCLPVFWKLNCFIKRGNRVLCLRPDQDFRVSCPSVLPSVKTST